MKETDWQVLGNPGATGEQLAEIYPKLRWADGEQPLKTLAQHPNCPPEIFTELLWRCPGAVGENPAWDLLLMEVGLPGNTRQLYHLLKQEDFHPRFLAALTLHKDPFVRELAQEHFQYRGEVEGELREALVALVRTLKRDGRLVWLARFRALPDGLNALLPYPITARPPLLLSDEEHRAEFLQRCAFSPGGLAPLIAAQYLDADYPLESLSEQVHWKCRLGAALNGRLPQEDLTQLAEDGNRWVRAVAQKRLAEPGWQLF